MVLFSRVVLGLSIVRTLRRVIFLRKIITNCQVQGVGRGRLNIVQICHYFNDKVQKCYQT